ncbi:MAG: tetratricopeptide repeat protein [Candidatus Kapabacteria bacterium]|nr:tetratricopeptide repeat protein [Candidatus Kapabacteria bacterium]
MKKIFANMLALFVGALMFQGFQCASPDLQTAQMAYNNKDLKKATLFLDKELNHNPNSPDRDCIRNGSEQYRNYLKTKDIKYLDSSIVTYTAGIAIKPQIAEFYQAKATAVELKGDTAEAMNIYIKYSEMIEPTAEFMIENGLTLGMPQSTLLTKFGKPIKSKIDSTSDGKEIIEVNKYEIKGKEVFFYSEFLKDKFKFMTFRGLRYNPPTEWFEDEKFQVSGFNIDPYGALATNYYQKKDYTNCLVYLQKIKNIQPDNTEVNKFITQVYQESGNSDIAIKSLEDNIKKEPTNKAYWAQYGEFLSRSKKYGESIEKFNKAIELDPNYDIALYNIASAYKNRAGEKQAEENERFAKNPKKPVNPHVYLSELKKSAEFFEKAAQTTKFKDNLDILKELSNIYQVTEDTLNQKKLMVTLEELEFSIPEKEKENYLYIMLKLYNMLHEEAKQTEIDDRIKNLKK